MNSSPTKHADSIESSPALNASAAFSPEYVDILSASVVDMPPESPQNKDVSVAADVSNGEPAVEQATVDNADDDDDDDNETENDKVPASTLEAPEKSQDAISGDENSPLTVEERAEIAMKVEYLQHRIRTSIDEACNESERLSISKEVQRIAILHFETQKNLKKATKPVVVKPLVIYYSLSVSRTEESKLVVIDLDNHTDVARVPTGAVTSATQYAVAGVHAFVLVVEVLERTTKDVLARVVSALELVRVERSEKQKKQETKKQKKTRAPNQRASPKTRSEKIIDELLPVTYLSVLQVFKTVRSMLDREKSWQVGAELNNAEYTLGQANKAFLADNKPETQKACDVAQKEVDELTTVFKEVCDQMKVNESRLEKQLADYIDFVMELKKKKTDDELQHIFRSLLTSSPIATIVAKRVERNPTGMPIVVMVRSKNGLLAYGPNGVTFMTPEDWFDKCETRRKNISDKAALEFDTVFSEQLKEHNGNSNAIILQVTDDCSGILFGDTIRSLQYIPNITEVFKQVVSTTSFVGRQHIGQFRKEKSVAEKARDALKAQGAGSSSTDA